MGRGDIFRAGLSRGSRRFGRLGGFRRRLRSRPLRILTASFVVPGCGCQRARLSLDLLNVKLIMLI